MKKKTWAHLENIYCFVSFKLMLFIRHVLWWDSIAFDFMCYCCCCVFIKEKYTKIYSWNIMLCNGLKSKFSFYFLVCLFALCVCNVYLYNIYENEIISFLLHNITYELLHNLPYSTHKIYSLAHKINDFLFSSWILHDVERVFKFTCPNINAKYTSTLHIPAIEQFKWNSDNNNIF